MKKMTTKLLTTTALLTLMVPAGFADNHTLSTDTNTGVDANVELNTEDGVSVDGEVNTDLNADASTMGKDGAMGTNTAMGANALLASNFMDKEVFVEGKSGAESVGNIHDIVMDEEGNAEWIIVGVGGFLGLGEKEVALSVDNIEWVERDGERVIVTSTTKADLEAEPAFDRAAVESQGEYSAERLSWTEEGQQWLKDTQMKAQKALDDMSMTDEQKGEDGKTAPTPPSNGENTDTTMTDGQDLAVEGQDGDMSTDGSAQMDTNTDWNWDADGMETIANGELSAEELIGTRVYGPDREDVGEISDVLMTQDGQVTAYIVDVGGFLGLGEKPVALSANELKIYTDANGEFRVRSEFTKETLESGPTYSEEEYNNNPDGVIIQ
ncbi:PRC-barrel domain-containing protein [Maritalea sp. S77]|uniref:PRC-barrel domain-containing protein n=1 Tax=Maritalea sp. S77 TaxID=3415125 RepID=UPI003C7B81FF